MKKLILALAFALMLCLPVQAAQGESPARGEDAA